MEFGCKMQQIGGILLMWRIRLDGIWNLTTYVFLSHVRDIGMKSVTYWYQFFTRCEELVPILHGVQWNWRSMKFTVHISLQREQKTVLPRRLPIYYCWFTSEVLFLTDGNNRVSHCTIKRVFSVHIQQDTFFDLSDRWLLIPAWKQWSFLHYFHSAINHHMSIAISMSPECIICGRLKQV